MHANSSPIASSQDGIHDKLYAQVARHAATSFRKPYSPPTRKAFDASFQAWQASGCKPLILDSGCGVGLSTLHLATRHPDHFVIGVDQSADRLSRQVRWEGAMPQNCLRVRADLVDFWRLMLESPLRPEAHYLLYPNPWPKKQHLTRRWHGHPVFPAMVALGGRFECRSNWRIYVEECAAALAQLSGQQIEVESWNPIDPITPFERKYLDSGHGLWRCRARLAAVAPTAMPGTGSAIFTAEQ
ncbi:class I SAM-dependent methyltransferase [Noviherbaspirillum pedocola]|uniref:tRNA (guanine(46)-N(7))-methyltransferase n=1 Tax=Noviherbaspirillum pedocola TaxID=2801341 RepID=A0A934SW46_9BURK|nr:SAM-dependent methyltransferase [Noviherbaspirillum pedocola]MBK4736488.1 SAM-dependent methyltransferase [Noviherbaspirillum pedocola]